MDASGFAPWIDGFNTMPVFGVCASGPCKGRIWRGWWGKEPMPGTPVDFPHNTPIFNRPGHTYATVRGFRPIEELFPHVATQGFKGFLGMHEVEGYPFQIRDVNTVMEVATRGLERRFVRTQSYGFLEATAIDDRVIPVHPWVYVAGDRISDDEGIAAVRAAIPRIGTAHSNEWRRLRAAYFVPCEGALFSEIQAL